MKTAIEFWGRIEGGVIKLPAEYLNRYSGLDAKVFVTVETEPALVDQRSRLQELFAQANELNMFSTISDPVAWQKDIRDEWE